MIKPGLALLLCILVFASSCGSFQEVTFSSIENVDVVKMSREGVEANVTAIIKNPNNTSFRIYKSEMDVTLNGIRCGKAYLSKSVRIKPKSEKSYTFNIKSDLSGLNMAELPKLINMALSKNVKVTLKGNLRVGKIFVKRNVPVEISRQVPLDGI